MAKVSEAKLPADLHKILAGTPKAQAFWKGLTPLARRDFISWVESAKQEETRKRRVMSIPSRLASGKRRPCCYAIVPMNLYKALGESKVAKKTWSALRPDERRDFVAWVHEAEGTDARAVRIAKACNALAAGKRRP